MTAFALHLGGVAIFNGRELSGWFQDTTALYTWERSLFIAAYAAAALGVDLLGSMVRKTGRTVLGRLSTTAFLIAAVLAVVVEASFLSTDASQTPSVVVMVVALFVAEAALGLSLIGSHLVSDWIGWLLIVWNVGWLAGFTVTRADDFYYPILHFVPLLFVAIGLLRRPSTATIPES
jgi:NADH:ubiquinone oxidoreductase subunit K